MVCWCSVLVRCASGVLVQCAGEVEVCSVV